MWGPNEFFTGRSTDYAFRRGGDYVPGAAFMLIRDTVWALVTSDAIDAAVVLAYNSPTESGFSTYYDAAVDAASDELASLNLATNAQTSMLDLIDDLCAV